MSVGRLVALTATFVFAFACTEPPTQPIESDPDFGVAGDKRVIGFANGSGHAPCNTIGFQCDPTDPTGGLRTFSFNAKLHDDGSASGHMQVFNRENTVQFRGNVVCVRFTQPNRVTAFVETTNGQQFGAIGPFTAFAVEDNGEGRNAPADKITNLIPGIPDNPNTAFIEPAVCNGNPVLDAILDGFFDDVLGYEIVNGNVQVRAPRP